MGDPTDRSVRALCKCHRARGRNRTSARREAGTVRAVGVMMGLVLRGGLPLIDRPGRGGGLERGPQLVSRHRKVLKGRLGQRVDHGSQEMPLMRRTVALIA